MRRKRISKPKDDELKAWYGSLDRHNPTPDLCVNWGKKVPKCDANLLLCILGNNFSILKDIKFIDELKSRGYDMSTLKFSIRKLPDVKEEKAEKICQPVEDITEKSKKIY